MAGVGIALSVYASVTKLFNVPLLAVTTSVVAKELGAAEIRQDADSDDSRQKIGVACSSALLIAVVVGLSEACAL